MEICAFLICDDLIGQCFNSDGTKVIVVQALNGLGWTWTVLRLDPENLAQPTVDLG